MADALLAVGKLTVAADASDPVRVTVAVIKLPLATVGGELEKLTESEDTSVLMSVIVACPAR